MKLTTARYYTPSGRSIQAKGIAPDIEVLQEVPDNLKAQTNSKGEASLRGHLKAQGGEETGSQSYGRRTSRTIKRSRWRSTCCGGRRTTPPSRRNPKAAVPTEKTVTDQKAGAAVAPPEFFGWSHRLPGDQMHLHPETYRNIVGALRHTNARCIGVVAVTGKPAAVFICFVFSRENPLSAFRDFCNTIPPKMG